jgi:signal transduction histidine kinase
MLRPLLAQKRVDMEVSCEDQAISGDEMLIEQLLINLLDNAIKASPQNSGISLKAYGRDAVTIEIADRGCGMDPGQLERVFEPFYRVDTARSRALGGAGLGLALSKQIADIHNAQILIESQIGQGTKITLIFTSSRQLYETFDT